MLWQVRENRSTSDLLEDTLGEVKTLYGALIKGDDDGGLAFHADSWYIDTAALVDRRRADLAKLLTKTDATWLLVCALTAQGAP